MKKGDKKRDEQTRIIDTQCIIHLLNEGYSVQEINLMLNSVKKENNVPPTNIMTIYCDINRYKKDPNFYDNYQQRCAIGNKSSLFKTDYDEYLYMATYVHNNINEWAKTSIDYPSIIVKIMREMNSKNVAVPRKAIIYVLSCELKRQPVVLLHNKVMSDETIEKMKLSQQKRRITPVSNETKDKMKLSQQARWDIINNLLKQNELNDILNSWNPLPQDNVRVRDVFVVDTNDKSIAIIDDRNKEN